MGQLHLLNALRIENIEIIAVADKRGCSIHHRVLGSLFRQIPKMNNSFDLGCSGFSGGGGSMDVPHSRPLIGPDDVKAVSETLILGKFAQGTKLKEFERAFSRFVGTKHL